MCTSLLCRNHRITEHVVIGTHGTLKNLLSKRILLFRHMCILVFDEADEMLKVGLAAIALDNATHTQLGRALPIGCRDS